MNPDPQEEPATLQEQTDLQIAEAARSAASCLADCVHTPEGSEDPIPLHVFRPLLSIIRAARLHRRPERLDRKPTRSQPTPP